MELLLRLLSGRSCAAGTSLVAPGAVTVSSGGAGTDEEGEGASRTPRCTVEVRVGEATGVTCVEELDMLGNAVGEGR